jgi:hypothetical protein
LLLLLFWLCSRCVCHHIVNSLLLIPIVKVPLRRPLTDVFFSHQEFFRFFRGIFLGEIPRRSSLIHPINASIHYGLFARNTIQFFLLSLLVDLFRKLFGFVGFGLFALFRHPDALLVHQVFGMP